MKLQNKYLTISYKCNLNNIDEELNSPKFKALINQNYNIKAIIPVEDSGSPTAIIILSNQPNNNEINYPYIGLIATITIILHIALQHLTL